MGSLWTDESAILRDLSFAQGRWVPGEIDAAVEGEKPPAHNVTEETEEEYFRHWTTDGDFSSGPDLMKIKKMLELMQGEEAPPEEMPSGSIEITKLIQKPPVMLNPKAIVYVPKVKNPKKNIKTITNKPRRMRNVAISSILALGGQISEVIEPLKLCKPEDFIKPKQEDEKESERVQDSVNKVSNWLQSQDMMPMFKKKSSVQSFTDDEQRISLADGSDSMLKARKTPVQSEGSMKGTHSNVKTPKAQGRKYVPTKWAEEYYKKAVDRSLMMDLVKDDVWGRAEKLMKDIDEKKAEELRKQQELEAEALLAAEIEAAKAKAEEAEKEDTCEKAANDFLSEDTTEGIAHMLLSKHRHELFSGECVVCKVLTVPSGTSPDNQDNAQDTIEKTREEIITNTPVVVKPREEKEIITQSQPSHSNMTVGSTSQPSQSVMPVSIGAAIFDAGYQLPELHFSGFSNEIIIRKPRVAEPEVTEPDFYANQVLQKHSLKTEPHITKSIETSKNVLEGDNSKTVPGSVAETDLTSEIKTCTEIATEPVNKQNHKPKHIFEQLLNSFDDFDDDHNLPNDIEKSSEAPDSSEPGGLMRTAFLENLNEENDDLRSTYFSDSDSYEDIDV